MILALSLFAVTVLADKFIFMNQSLAGLLENNGRASFQDHANRAILNECLYETETVKLWDTPASFGHFKVEACPVALVALKSENKRSLNDPSFNSTYKCRRTITALSAGGLSGFCSGVSVDQMLRRAEYAKKPLGTRVGKLLKQQHRQWINKPETLAPINNCAELCDYLNKAQHHSYAWGLFVQIMLIFGFLDVNNPVKHINFLRVIEHSAFYKIYLERDHIILPTIDRFITLMIHDPTMQAYRSDAFSTLQGWSLGTQDMENHLSTGDWLSDMDRLVIDYLDKQHNVQFHPHKLFHEPK